MAEGSWRFSQCFGDKSDTLEVADADVISAVRFDRTGDYLASGDRAGRVVLFERAGGRRGAAGCEYRFYAEFQSHEPEFDYLKSLEINERINEVAWCARGSDAHHLLTANDKTIKLWRVRERGVHAVVENNLSVVQGARAAPVSVPGAAIGLSGAAGRGTARVSLVLPRTVREGSVVSASPARVFSNAHAYHIHSVALSADDETFLSADDLRVNVWNLRCAGQSLNVVDMKPASIEELTEVITTAAFHPTHGSVFAFGTSRGDARLCDMRAAALCDRGARVFKRDDASSGAPSFFSELVSSVSDASFSPDGRLLVTRDYLCARVWDVAMERTPLAVLPVHDAVRPRLCDLYESDAIFDRFGASFNHDGSLVLAGSYSNYVRVLPSAGPPGGPGADLIHADKSIFRSGAHSRRASRVRVPDGPASPSPAAAPEDPLAAGAPADGVDYERKVLHAAVHPRENTVAVAALSNLFVFSQLGR